MVSRAAGWLPVVCLLALGCTNMQDVVQARDAGRGTMVTYPVSEEQAWKITNTILRIDPPSGTVDERRGDGYVLLKINQSILGSGTYIGIWVEPVSAGQTKVTFVRKQRVASDTIRSWTSDGFHKDFQSLVALLGSTCQGAPAASASSAPAASASSAPAASASSAPAASSSAPAIREVPLPPRRAN